MKIGILTLVNQLNYGGVLQAYALQRVLRDRGYDVEVVNYWLNPQNTALYGYYLNPVIPLWRKMRSCLRFRLVPLFRSWAPGERIRRRKTVDFLNTCIAFSKGTYSTPAELGRISEYDSLIVGSDQVWNFNWFGTPNPFLLGNVSAGIRKIAYAPSFGFKELPSERLEEYRSALLRFDYLSAREREGAFLIREWTGREVDCVLDPSVLLADSEWDQILPPRSSDAKNYIFCYWLGALDVIIPKLKQVSRQRGIPFRLYTGDSPDWGSWKGPESLLKRMRLGDGEIVRTAGPLDFVSGIRDAAIVLSDSFHALMFAIIFERPVRIVIESSAGRSHMSARFTDFCEKFNIQPQTLFCDIESIVSSDFNVQSMREMLGIERTRSLGLLLSRL